MPLASSKAARTSWNAASSAPPHSEVTRIEPSPASRSAAPPPLAPGSPSSLHAASVSTATMAGARIRYFRIGSSTCSVNAGHARVGLGSGRTVGAASVPPPAWSLVVRRSLPGEGLLRFRVEDVQLVHRHRQLHLVSDAHLRLGGQQRDDLVPLGLGVDELLVAEVLDDVDLGWEAYGIALLAVGDLDVLRTEADEHVRTVRARVSGLGLLARQLELYATEKQILAFGFRRREVHGRRADEAGDEDVDRVVVQLLWHADLLED